MLDEFVIGSLASIAVLLHSIKKTWRTLQIVSIKVLDFIERIVIIWLWIIMRLIRVRSVSFKWFMIVVWRSN